MWIYAKETLASPDLAAILVRIEDAFGTEKRFMLDPAYVDLASHAVFVELVGDVPNQPGEMLVWIYPDACVKRPLRIHHRCVVQGL